MRARCALLACWAATASAWSLPRGGPAPRSAARGPAPRPAVAMDAGAMDAAEGLKAGAVVPCTILEAHESGGYSVEIGAARPALLPRLEVVLDPNSTNKVRGYVGKGWAALDAGDVFEGQVLAVGADGAVNVSLAIAQRNVAWRRVAQLSSEDVTYPATVLRFGEAGATLAVERLPAFLPWSHWQLPPSARTAEVIGTKLDVKFLEADRPKERLIVSHRRVRLDAFVADLEPGQVVEGEVSGVKEYGAVVNLGDGLDGLLHISQLSQSYVKAVSDAVAVGDVIKCVVIKIDNKDGSVSLSTKMLEAEPGEILADAKAVFERTALGPRDRTIR